MRRFPESGSPSRSQVVRRLLHLHGCALSASRSNGSRVPVH